jgi:hypothetical protein
MLDRPMDFTQLLVKKQTLRLAETYQEVFGDLYPILNTAHFSYPAKV